MQSRELLACYDLGRRMRFRDGSRHGTERRGDVGRRHDLVPILEVDNLGHNLADSLVRSPEVEEGNLVHDGRRDDRGCEVARRDLVRVHVSE